MKADFTNILASPVLDGEPQPINFAKEIGNRIYGEAMTIEEADLARKIHSSQGEIEVSEEEKAIILKAIQPYKLWVRKPIEEMLNKQES